MGAMESKGIKIGWTLTKIAKKDATKMSIFVIKNELINNHRAAGPKGYNITFEGEYIKKTANTAPNTANITTANNTSNTQQTGTVYIIYSIYCDFAYISIQFIIYIILCSEQKPVTFEPKKVENALKSELVKEEIG